MENQFYILLSLKTPSGFETYGQYFLGNNREYARAIFDSLSGSRTITEQSRLHLDFMETIGELPVKIKTICCTLEELGHNCKLIAKETFLRYNFEEM